MRTAAALVVVVAAALVAGGALGCGMSVHNEVARRASVWFASPEHPEYVEFVQQATAWVQPGAFYPDWGFACSGWGNEAEHSHWPPYLNATVNVIKAKYPRPWGRDVHDKIAFVLGLLAHSVGDTPWHSLGMREGFINMVSTGDGTSYGDAHSHADNGGEFVLKHFSDVDYIERRWYTPSEDLADAYALNGYTVDPALIERCMKIGFIGAWGNKIAGELLFRYVEEYPAIVEQIQNYFGGGLNDMATWTEMCWEDVVGWFETNAERRPFCRMLENQWRSGLSSSQLREDRYPLSYFESAEERLEAQGFRFRTGHVGDAFYTEIYREDGVDVDVWVRETRAKMVVGRQEEDRPERAVVCEPDVDWAVRRLATEVSLSQLGASLATGDFAGVGASDLAVGAPAYGTRGNAQRGAVFILSKFDRASSGVEQIEQAADLTLLGPEARGRFGTALAVVDLNADGIDDLAVSAPTVNMDQMYYDGRVYVYFGAAGRGLSSTPDLVLTVQQRVTEPPSYPPDSNWTWEFKYTLLGTQLFAGDVDGDGCADLIVGSPHASTTDTNSQVGTVLVFKSSTRHRGTIEASAAADVALEGVHNYDWFGHSVALADTSGGLLLVVGEPGFNPITANGTDGWEAGATFGRVSSFRLTGSPGRENPPAVFTIAGNQRLARFGHTLAVGDFFGSGNGTALLAVASPAEANGDGKWLSGVVRVLDVSRLSGAVDLDSITPLTTLRGGQNAGLLGAGSLTVTPQALWVGEPLYGSLPSVRDRLGLETGRVLAITRGTGFPRGGYAIDDVAAQCVRGAEAKERFGAAVSAGAAVAVGAPHAYTLNRLGGQVLIGRV